MTEETSFIDHIVAHGRVATAIETLSSAGRPLSQRCVDLTFGGRGKRVGIVVDAYCRAACSRALERNRRLCMTARAAFDAVLPIRFFRRRRKLIWH